MDAAGIIYQVYEIVWSVLAIIGGILLLVFREKFIEGTERISRSWYDRTGFFVFRLQAENTDSTSMRMVSVVVAIIFIVVGLSTLLNFF